MERCLAGVAAHDPLAMQELYTLASTPVYAYALSILKNRSDAEDALQECFVKIYTAASSYRSQGKPMAWLMTVTRHICYDKLARAAKEISCEDLPERLSPEGDVALREDSVVLRECLHRLTSEERQIVILHAVAGIKHRQIAALLRLPLSTVLSKYSRAIQKLRKQLEGIV